MKTVKSKLSFLAIISIALFGLASCSKKTNSGPPPPVLIGGYASSDSVAAANLISYFNFDNNINDTKGGGTGTGVGVTYGTGIRGEAYQGAKGAYATVPASAAIAALTSFSVSVWYQYTSSTKPQIPTGGAQNAQGLFFASGKTPGADGNEILLEADNPSPTQFAADSVPIHHGFDNVGGAAGTWENFTMNSFDTATSSWVHVVLTYDGPSSTYKFYENGQPIAVSSAYGVSAATIIYNGPLPVGSGTPATTTMGPISFTPDPPTTLYIGTWPPGLYGVSATLGANGSFLGAMDELRVFSRALTQAEVVGLYLNGQAGR